MNIVVVGGGTAGWISALYAKKINPQSKITLIESEKIGILGAGEGGTPSLVELFLFLDISFVDLIKNCQISIKNGVRFTNWSSKKDSFFHPFGSDSLASNDCNFFPFDRMDSDTGFSHIFASQFDHTLEDYSFFQKFSNEKKVPFFSPLNFYENMFIYERESSFSIHFDANLLAQYLKSVAQDRGILREEGIVEEIVTDENGYITKLLTNKHSFSADFVIDCTGFRRLIIGNFYNSSWKSHKESLPVDSAIPFFLPKEEDIPPYSEAIAMDYGWMWKVPLQHRYGCGYVFDSGFISMDDAKTEIENYLGLEVSPPKTFSFNAGCYEQVWIKNCLAVGLASGFIEPLEGSSIWQAIRTLESFFSSYENLYTKNEKIKEKFNRQYLLETQEVVDFLYLHYINDKKNTDFWKNFSQNNKMPEFIEHVLSVIKNRPLDHGLDFAKKEPMFGVGSYFYVLIGNNLIDNNILQKYLTMMKVDKTMDYLKIIENQNKIIPRLMSHKDFLSKGLEW